MTVPFFHEGSGFRVPGTFFDALNPMPYTLVTLLP